MSRDYTPPTRRLLGALALLALGACDGDGTGPSGDLTPDQVSGIYAVCELRFVPAGAQPEVNIAATAFEPGSFELAVDRGVRNFEMQYTPKGEFTDRELPGTYELGDEEISLRFGGTTDTRDEILLPERIRLDYQESPKRLTAAGTTQYEVARADYARLAGIPETGLADRIPGRLHAGFGAPNCD